MTTTLKTLAPHAGNASFHARKAGWISEAGVRFYVRKDGWADISHCTPEMAAALGKDNLKAGGTGCGLQIRWSVAALELLGLDFPGMPVETKKGGTSLSIEELLLIAASK